MKRLFAILCVILAPAFITPTAAQNIQKQIVKSQGKSRGYYLFVPDKLTADQPAPLLLLLHGSGHNGMSLVEKWKDLAKKERIILVGPDSTNPEMWSTSGDGPDFLHDLITEVQSKYPIDPHRLYLFGHSGGACFALYMALYESEYFAATAIHAGALRTEDKRIVAIATRKIPIYIVVGTVDKFFPLADVRATRDMLNTNGFSAQLNEMPGHDHWYYDLAPKINAGAWNFLKEQKLAGDPHYTQYSFR